MTVTSQTPGPVRRAHRAGLFTTMLCAAATFITCAAAAPATAVSSAAGLSMPRCAVTVDLPKVIVIRSVNTFYVTAPVAVCPAAKRWKFAVELMGRRKYGSGLVHNRDRVKLAMPSDNGLAQSSGWLSLVYRGVHISDCRALLAKSCQMYPELRTRQVMTKYATRLHARRADDGTTTVHEVEFSRHGWVNSSNRTVQIQERSSHRWVKVRNLRTDELGNATTQLPTGRYRAVFIGDYNYVTSYSDTF